MLKKPRRLFAENAVPADAEVTARVFDLAAIADAAFDLELDIFGAISPLADRIAERADLLRREALDSGIRAVWISASGECEGTEDKPGQNAQTDAEHKTQATHARV